MKFITKKNLWIWVSCIIIITMGVLRFVNKKSFENFEIAIETGGSTDIGNIQNKVNASQNVLPPVNTTTYINQKQPWTSNNQNIVVVNEANLAKSVRFGPPLGNSISAHEKINRIVDGIKNELTNIFAQIPDNMLNTPLKELPSPMNTILTQSLSSLFPITSAAMNMPLNKLLNTENSLNQIADLLQPPVQSQPQQ